MFEYNMFLVDIPVLPPSLIAPCDICLGYHTFRPTDTNNIYYGINKQISASNVMCHTNGAFAVSCKCAVTRFIDVFNV